MAARTRRPGAARDLVYLPMPELPEVETIRRQLAPHLEGRTIVARRDPRPALDAARTRRRPSSGRCAARASSSGSGALGQVPRSGSCRASATCSMHLRMTGTLLFDPPAEPLHTRVRFELDAGHRLVYVDPRRFGTGHLLSRRRRRATRICAARLGVEPLTPEFTAEHLRERRARATRAGQVVPARPAADRRRRQHLCRRGAVPGRRSTRCARPGS